jgi:hypothetical protein
MEKIFEKITKLIDIKEYHLFMNNKIIVSAKTLPSLKKKIKEDFDNPEKDIKCFIVSLSLDLNYKYPLMINCSSYTITPKLSLISIDDDVSQTFTYSKKELEEYSFKLSHIKKIIKVLKKDLVSFEKSTISITNVFKVLDK